MTLFSKGKSRGTRLHLLRTDTTNDNAGLLMLMYTYKNMTSFITHVWYSVFSFGLTRTLTWHRNEMRSLAIAALIWYSAGE